MQRSCLRGAGSRRLPSIGQSAAARGHRFPIHAVIALALLVALAAPGLSRGEQPYQVAWMRQPGTPNNDYGNSVAVDTAGNAFISGWTYGSLGAPSAGDADAFLSRYDSAGNVLWSRQLGTWGDDRSHSVAVDSGGNAFISGYTYGALSGPNAGLADAFLSKYDSTGSLLWTRQLGTSSGDYSSSVAVDGAGNAFITGITRGPLNGPNAGSNDAFLSKYNSAGSLLWTRQLGTSGSDFSRCVAVDVSGNAFMSGYTEGSLGGPNAGQEDAFLCKYDPAGNLLWSRQLGTSKSDWGYSVAVDSGGNAFISGTTKGSLGGPNAGGTDVFLSKYDSAGSLLWTQQLGTSSYDHSTSVAVDAAGNVLISGFTEGSLGAPNAGYSDAFLSKYDPAVGFLWTQQLGTPGYDESWSVALDGAGIAFITGHTGGSLGGPNAGYHDAFLVKFVVPEPACLSLLAIGGLTFLKRKRNQRRRGVPRRFGNGQSNTQGRRMQPAGAANQCERRMIVKSLLTLTIVLALAAATAQAAYVTDPAQGALKLRLQFDLAGNATLTNITAAAVAIDGYENAYMAGFFRSNIDFDPGPEIDEHSYNLGEDIFLTKLLPNGFWEE